MFIACKGYDSKRKYFLYFFKMIPTSTMLNIIDVFEANWNFCFESSWYTAGFKIILYFWLILSENICFRMNYLVVTSCLAVTSSSISFTQFFKKKISFTLRTLSNWFKIRTIWTNQLRQILQRCKETFKFFGSIIF